MDHLKIGAGAAHFAEGWTNVTKQKRQIDYQNLESSELAWLAQTDKDPVAVEMLCIRGMELAKKSAIKAARKYTWLDADDLQQSLLVKFIDQIIRRYRPGKNGTSWEKFSAVAMAFALKDVLRAEDPLGISWPQKQHYPEWYRLGDKVFTDADFDIQSHREMTHQEWEDLQFIQSIEDWRAAFRSSKPVRRRRFTEPLANDIPPAAWVNGKYVGKYIPKRKRMLPRLAIGSWIRNRRELKNRLLQLQLELF